MLLSKQQGTPYYRHIFFQDAILKTGGLLEEYMYIKTIYLSGLLAISMPSGLLANMASRLLDLWNLGSVVIYLEVRRIRIIKRLFNYKVWAVVIVLTLSTYIHKYSLANKMPSQAASDMPRIRKSKIYLNEVALKIGCRNMFWSQCFNQKLISRSGWTTLGPAIVVQAALDTRAASTTTAGPKVIKPAK